MGGRCTRLDCTTRPPAGDTQFVESSGKPETVRSAHAYYCTSAENCGLLQSASAAISAASVTRQRVALAFFGSEGDMTQP